MTVIIPLALEPALLWLIVLFVGIEIGGGLYEWRCIYPLWSKDPSPQTLRQKIQESGQELAGRRFWPFVSPPVLLLSILNIVAAFQSVSAQRPIWLLAAAIALLDKVATYIYFAPTLVLRLSRPEAISPSKLTRIVRVWVRLSPLRILAAFVGWVGFGWVMAHFGN